MLLFIILTWIIPAGAYERTEIEGRNAIVPGSYTRTEQQPQGLKTLFTAPIKGFVEASQIIAFVLLIGGAFGIVNKTGAINAGLSSIIRFSLHHPGFKLLIVPLIMVLFSLGGATFGMSEEVLVFIIITVPMAIALGYDSITGVAIPFVGAGAGFAGAVFNPFTVGIAQGIAEVDIFSGWEYRIVVWLVFTSIAIIYVIIYTRKIEKNKTYSKVYEIDLKRDKASIDAAMGENFNSRQLIIILLLILTLVILVLGVNLWHWYIDEIAGLFIGFGILSAIVYKLSLKETSSSFIEGAKDMVMAALVIGFARGLLVIASEGKIIDTILFTLSNATGGLPAALSVQVMFLFQSFLNFFIPSGSGQAALTMPIMAPLSDFLGISRQTAVLAYQFGDGLSNLIIPTSGITMGILSIAEIPYLIWLRWILRLMVILFLAAMILLLPPVLIFEWN
jgi:uncharacterized ion transporter superfamily protein YfcC